MRGVEALENFLGAIRKPAVAEQKPGSAKSKILLMRGHNPVGDECHSGALVAPVPRIAHRKTPKLERSIVFGVGERLVAPIAPSESPEHAHLRRDLLFEVQ